MVIVTHESYNSVLVGTGKEPLSENREWRRRCDVERQVVSDGGNRNRKRPLADCRETNKWNFQTMRGRRLQRSSGCHLIGNYSYRDVARRRECIEWRHNVGVILIRLKNFLRRLRSIHLVAVGVIQVDVVRLGAVRVRQQHFVRVVGHVIKSLLHPRAVDFGGKTMFALSSC